MKNYFLPLKYDSFKKRYEAVEALYELKSIDGIIEALNKGSSDVRISVSEFLKSVDDPKVIDNLNKTLLSKAYSRSVRFVKKIPFS